MQQKQRIIIAAGVVAGGVAVALLFRKPQSADESPTSAVVGESAATPRFLAETSNTSTTDRPEAASRAASKTTGSSTTKPSVEPPTKTPAADSAARQPFQWVDPQPPEIDLQHPGEAGDPFAAHPFDAGEVAGETPGEKPKTPRRRHRVRDGDTLRDLARRYLGDPARAIDILEANRDRLEDPEVLPIGAELEIPNLAAPQSAAKAAAASLPR